MQMITCEWFITELQSSYASGSEVGRVPTHKLSKLRTTTNLAGLQNLILTCLAQSCPTQSDGFCLAGIVKPQPRRKQLSMQRNQT
jgi:hypothetical protein